MLSNPTDKKALQLSMQELSNSKARARAESAFQREEITALSEKYEIPKKFLSKMANDYHRQTFKKGVEESEEYVNIYENIFPVKSEE